ncbi:MAG: thioredoxin family protein [Candidatus Zixiibacteriota bacterium]
MQTQIKSKWVYGIMGGLVLGMTIFTFSCGKNEEGRVEAQERSQKTAVPIQAGQTQTTPSIASQRLSQAMTNGKYVYLFFYEPDNADCQTMAKNLDAFARRNKKDVEIIKVDRKDPNNSDIVNTLKTQTAPIPLTLLFDPSSAIVAAFTKVVTPDELLQAFPSTKKAETLKYMQQGKGVILCFSNKKMSSRGDVQSCCSQAENQLAGKAEYISVDLSDPNEAAFIRELKVDPNTSVPVTFVVNSQGQVTGKYDGAVQVNNLVAAATKVVKSGCCPPSSGKSCAPTTAQKK